MAEYNNLEGMELENLEALAGEFSLEDLAEFDTELQFDPADFKPAKPVYTKKQKAKMLLMNNTATAIIKWAFAFLGIVAAVLYILALVSPDISEIFSTTITPVVREGLTAISNLLPYSLMEIMALVVAGGLVLYIGFLIWRTCVAKNGFKAFGYWFQFLYTLLAVAGVSFLLFTLCYGVTENRPALYKSAFKAYQPNLFLEQNLDNSLIYYIDNVNNVACEAVEQESIYYTPTGHARYDSTGRSTAKIGSAVNACFKLAAKDYPMLKGPEVEVKEMMASPLYTAMGVGSMYSPFTGEVLINTDFPELAVPMQIAQAIAKHRGFTDPAEARFIAYLVCTKYADQLDQAGSKYNMDFIKYSAYMDAYMEVGNVAYPISANIHLYCSAALKESAKKDMIAYTAQLDKLYGNISKLEFVSAANKTPTADYKDLAKLLYVDFNTRVNDGYYILSNNTPEKPVKATSEKYMYCRYLVAYFLSVEPEFTAQAMDVYSSYNPEPQPNDGTVGDPYVPDIDSILNGGNATEGGSDTADGGEAAA